MTDYWHTIKKRRPISDINVVPYIDVMLVLLVIFMVTAPLITQGIQVNLPEAKADTINNNDNLLPLVASVDHLGNYYLNVGESTAEPISAQQLAILVAAHLTIAPNTPVVVKGDKHVEYQQVVELMVLLQQQAGVVSIGLMTNQQIAESK